MFDIGQNDLAGAFYSKSFDQIVASIPSVLVEFEAGIKVRFGFFHMFTSSIPRYHQMHQNITKFYLV